MTAKPLFLLDLNYTLINATYGDGSERIPLAKRIGKEEYRPWLVDLLRPHTVIIVTARPARWKHATMEDLKKVTGWEPQGAIFNYTRLPPPEFKRKVLREFFFELKGYRPDELFSIESNPRTRAMYAAHGVRSTKVGSTEWISIEEMLAEGKLFG